MRLFALVLGSGLVAACGGGTAPQTPPDAGMAPDAAPHPDAPPAFAGCSKFTSAALHVPFHTSAQLTTAAITAPTSCPGDAPFGIATSGPDNVLHVDGLTVGATYVVRLSAKSDLSFYVVSGCGSDSGPTAAQCLLFEDAQKAGVDEVGEFVALGTSAYVVVDYYASSSPDDTTFALDVYAKGCTDASGCTSDTPACVDGACVECATSFDCTNAAKPVCNSATHACIAAPATACTSDDASAPADDGPAGAQLIVLDQFGSRAINGQICSAPLGQADYLAFDVATVGETWDLKLAWSGQRDLDLEIDDAHGNVIGLSYYDKPEDVRLRYLAPGRYYAHVSEYATTPNASALAYTLTAGHAFGTGCTSASDCASEYRNQTFRGSCEAGSCVDIAGDGAVTEGGACDSQDDCGPGLSCPSFYFVSNADTRETCERTCTADGDCAPLGSEFVCTTYVATNFCVRRCQLDDDCPTSLTTQPSSGQPWYRLRCNESTGRCTP